MTTSYVLAFLSLYCPDQFTRPGTAFENFSKVAAYLHKLGLEGWEKNHESCTTCIKAARSDCHPASGCHETLIGEGDGEMDPQQKTPSILESYL